jgi:hypothetical protein
MGNPKDFWPDFSSATSDPLPNRCGTGSLASDVLTTFGIAHQGVAGGPLANLDIKHMDADQLIKLSLLDDDSGSIKEMITDEYGLVRFKEIGSGSGLSGGEIYHQIQSATFVETCKGVMVTGGKPLPTRKDTEFKAIWGTGPKEIYNAFWVSENGMSEIFSQYATIVFNDPQLNSEYKDGIDNLYDITNPWESIIGYARYIDWPGSEDSPETTVERANTSTIPILIAGSEGNNKYNAPLGTLQTKPVVAQVGGASLDSGSTVSAHDGIKVPIPDTFRYTTVRGSKLDKLIGIHSVIIVGRRVHTLIGIPSGDSAAMRGSSAKGSDAEIMACIDSIRDSMYTLKAGDHYVISYQDKTPYVVFASNSRAFEPATFGSNVSVKIDEDSIFGGQTLDGVSVLPTGGSDGYLVKQVIVLVNLQTPCINVYDPRPGKALEIAEGLTYQLCPLVSVELPAPVAFNGGIIDQTEGIVDHDPTTTQNLTDTAYENAIDTMNGGGGLAVTLSFLDENGCAEMSNKLFQHLNGGNGSVTTYVCGPNTTAELGGYGADSASIVNDIAYSYSDSNSYTVSVTTGPKLLGGLANITEGATTKTTENVPSTGRVIQDMGNHVQFKVLLDGCGLGPVVAINTAPKVIRVGDRVQCTVYNNPVEQ